VIRLVQKSKELSASNLEESERLAVKTLDDVRRIITDLRPTVLDDLGLAPALRQLAGDLRAATSAVVAVQVLDLPARLAPQLESTLFRIAQEALANVRRHARAHNVIVTLSAEHNTVRLTVQDDGDGMDQPNTLRQAGDVTVAGGWVERAGHFGLLGMQERASWLAGTFSLESKPGAGTTVCVELPLLQDYR
jgi:signal transduction histidine kinase